jgi:NAD(P)-dependent dehydrogenase (short-subunit alcohol dehydrogenase family)
MNIEFSNKIVIITGGSRGIGSQIVKSFAKLGAKVFFTHKSSYVRNNDIANIEKQSIFGFKVNNSDPLQIREFIKTIGEKYNQIDILINNAAIVVKSPLENLSIEDWDVSMNVNLRAAFLYSIEALPFLKKSEFPSITNISSIRADRPYKNLGIYCTTKAGLEALTRALMLEFAQFRIRVNSIAPGLIETDDIESVKSNEFQEKVLDIPFSRAGYPLEVANVVLFLASPFASYVTGSQIYVSGGYI